MVSPVDGEPLGTVANVTPEEFETILSRCHKAWMEWRLVPAPKRGEVVKALGDELRRNQEALARLVTGDGQDAEGEPGRGPGNDRYL